MVRVDSPSITMTRGDTLRVSVSIDRDGDAYTPESGDEIQFFLKHNVLNGKRTAYKDSQPLITKDVPIATMVLELEPEDTKPLEFGDYVYDLQLTFANGTVDTFINNAPFKIVPEVG